MLTEYTKHFIASGYGCYWKGFRAEEIRKDLWDKEEIKVASANKIVTVLHNYQPSWGLAVRPLVGVPVGDSLFMLSK